MSERPVLAYLTSAYGRAADTFIRGEVKQLRALGFTVHTFSIRRPEKEQIVSEEVSREQAGTHYILEAGPGRLIGAALKMAIKRPAKFLAMLKLAQRAGPPGIKPRLWRLAYLLEAAHLASQMEKLNVGHLHNHIGENSAAVAMLASGLSEIPFSMTVHGPNEFDHPVEIALGEKIRHAEFVAAVSSFGKSQLCRWCATKDWDKIKIIRCGVDEEFLGRPLTLPPTNGQLVSIGRLSEQKGQHVLIEAAAMLAREGQNFRVLLIGDGPMRGELEAAVKREGLDDKVVLAGWMNGAQVRQAILESRALVMPSFAEGLPVVLMEALALGRPAISTAIAGIPELVKDGVNGWLVAAGSAPALADAMRAALATSSDDLARLGQVGAKDVARLHNARIEAAKLAQLYWVAG